MGLNDPETYIKGIWAAKARYDGKLVIEKLNSFADEPVQHLYDVHFQALDALIPIVNPPPRNSLP